MVIDKAAVRSDAAAELDRLARKKPLSSSPSQEQNSSENSSECWAASVYVQSPVSTQYKPPSAYVSTKISVFLLQQYDLRQTVKCYLFFLVVYLYLLLMGCFYVTVIVIRIYSLFIMLL